jgi:Resolvase, N terminal domain
MNHSKITAERLLRKAVVYIRQSSPNQVLHHQESQRRQYGLVDRARDLGFQQVIVIDEDLGRTGSGLVERPGFQRLVAEVCGGEVSAVFCIEASRLARNGRDWHHLIELCGMADAVVVDFDGVYDPNIVNDRLLLGLNRPETQSTSNSTFCWTGIVGQFRVGARLPALQAVPPADISDVVTRKSPAERTAQPGAIQRRGDFGVGTPRR